MLQIVCVNVGPKFEPEYVYRMQRALSLHLTVPFDFAVVTDQPDQYRCRTLPAMDNLKGYWQKVTLFAPARREQYVSNRVLYLDLDVVITGNLDELALYTAAGFMALKDQLIPDCINSSIMLWNFDDFTHVYTNFVAPDHPWGDQGYIMQQVWPVYLQSVFGEAQYPDYKENLKHREPIGHEKIVWFHGVPQPHECQWVQDLWREQRIEYSRRFNK